MAVQASQVLTVDLTDVDVSDHDTTVNAEIETMEAGDWVVFSTQYVHVTDPGDDGNAKFLCKLTFQKHEIL